MNHMLLNTSNQYRSVEQKIGLAHYGKDGLADEGNISSYCELGR